MKNSLYLLAAVLLVAFAAGGVYASAPTLSNVQASGITSSQAWVSWSINQTGFNNTVYYGESTSLGSTGANATNATTSGVLLTGLRSSEKHYFQVRSCSAAGLCTLSSVMSFQTLCSGGAGVAIGCDTVEGLPSVGSDLGGFLTGLAPGLGGFIVVVAVFLGIAAIIGSVVYLVVVGSKKAFK